MVLKCRAGTFYYLSPKLHFQQLALLKFRGINEFLDGRENVNRMNELYIYEIITDSWGIKRKKVSWSLTSKCLQFVKSS